MSYTNLLYHIVYATKERAPLITEELRPELHRYLGGTVRKLGGIGLEVNGTSDHVHFVAKLPPTISVADFLSKLKIGFVRLGQTTNQRQIRVASAIRSVHSERVPSRSRSSIRARPGKASSAKVS